MSVEAVNVLTPFEIESALDRGDLVVVYQPCYDLRTGALVAVEALCRIRDHDGALIPPDRFLPVAEDAGLIARLDDLVLATATRQVAYWRTLPGAEGLCVSINVSVVGLDDPTLPARFQARAADAGLPADALIVELTETVLSRAGRGHEQVVAGLSELGCNVTLDDFGTGNASFEYLQRFHISGIKVDRSFVHFLGSGGRGERLAESMVRFCLSLGVPVVAEGVENHRQLAALRNLGCTFVQGFLLDAPMSAEEIDQRIRGGALRLLAREPMPLPPATVPVRAPRFGEGRAVSAVLALLLAVFLVGLPVYAVNAARASEDRLLRAAQDRLIAVDSLAASRVDSQIDALTGVLTAFSRSAPVRAAVASQDPAQLDDAMAALEAIGPDFSISAMYDADGRLLVIEPAAPRLIGDTFAYRDYFQGAIASRRAYVSEAFEVATDGSWTIAVSAAVRDDAGAVLGVVGATLSLEGLRAELRAVLDQHGTTVTLTDSRTRILAGTEGDIGQPTSDPRLLADAPGQTADPTAAGVDDLWAVRAVPAVGGWLLAEQPTREALDAEPGGIGFGVWAIGGVGAAGLALLLLWLSTDRRRRRLDAEVERAHDQVTAILDATPAPIVVSDAEDRIVLANPAFAALVGVETDTLPGQPLVGWLPGRGLQDPGGGQTSSVVTTVGDLRTVEVDTQDLPGQDGRLRLHTLADVTPHRREHDRLRAQGRRDPLTGAANRRALREALVAAAHHATATYAVAMFDLDGFKNVNDDLGHAVGDQLLCLVADTLAAAMGPNDLVARPGGDEFVVLVRLDGPGQEARFAEQLRGRILAALDAQPGLQNAHVGASVGVAVVGEDGIDPDTLLQVADQRVYRAKRRTR